MHFVSGDIKFLIYHLIWKDRLIKGSCDYVWKSLKISGHPAKFNCHGCCSSGDITFSVVE